MLIPIELRLVSVLACALVAACGGGGGGETPVAHLPTRTTLSVMMAESGTVLRCDTDIPMPAQATRLGSELASPMTCPGTKVVTEWVAARWRLDLSLTPEEIRAATQLSGL